MPVTHEKWLEQVDRLIQAQDPRTARKSHARESGYVRKDMPPDQDKQVPNKDITSDAKYKMQAPSDKQAASADIVIITALQKPEKTCVMKEFSGEWYTETDNSVYYHCTTWAINEKPVELKVAVACQNEMGMVPAAILTIKAINYWKPRYIIMTGICGGEKGKVNLGDIIIVDNVFDYGSGKIRPDGKLQPDYKPIQMDLLLGQMISHFAATANKFLAEMTSIFPVVPGEPQTQINAHFGSMASGAAVVADDKVLYDITEHYRNLLGIDMESYGVAKSVSAYSKMIDTRYIIVKSVSDFADGKKGDVYQEFCSFASAKFVKSFIQEYVEELFPDKFI